MKAIIAQLIAAAIDPEKIPSLDFFDMKNKEVGEFSIWLNDGTEIVVTCDIKN